METLELPEMNISTGKSERKKTSLMSSSRSKSRNYRRSHPAVDDAIVNNHSASALTVSIGPIFLAHPVCLPTRLSVHWVAA